MLAVFSVHYPAFVHTTGAYAPAPRPAWRSGASPIAVEYAVDVPYQEAEYDPAAASAFFEKRPLVAIRRALQIVRRSGGFVISTLLDKKLGREEQMVDRRSQEEERGFAVAAYATALWTARMVPHRLPSGRAHADMPIPGTARSIPRSKSTKSAHCVNPQPSSEGPTPSQSQS